MKALNFSSKESLASLVLRIFIGGMFLVHGLGKPFVVGMETVIQGFIEQGFPVWTVYASTVVEIVGGVMLISGFYTRLASLALIPITIGILVNHFPFGWVFHNTGGGWEYPQLILIALIAIFLLGTGKYGLKKSK